MPLCFRSFVTFAVPGVLALLGCWWIYSHRKKHGTYEEEPAVAAEEQQEEVAEQDSAPGTEPCVPQRQLSLLEEEHIENKTSTSLLTAGLTMPSVTCHTGERLDLSTDLPVTTNQPSTLENDSEKLEETGSQDEKSVPVCVSLPWEPACSAQPGEEDVSRSVASTVPVCQEEEDTQPKGDELRREKVRGVGLCKEDIEKIEQVTIQIVSKVILAATEEVLSGVGSDGSTQLCQAAASQAETPLEMASAVSAGQTLVEEAAVADTNTAGKNDAVVLTSPQTEEQAQDVTCSSCSAQSPTEGATTDCQMKAPVCSESQGGGRTPVEIHKGSPEKSPLVREGSLCSTSTCEGGACVEGLVQSTVLAVASGQHSELLSLPASGDTSAGQSSGPSETQPPVRLPEDNDVPYSTGVLREDGPDLCNECSKAPGIDGDCPQGLDGHGTGFVNSGCAMKKAVTQQDTEIGRETSKCNPIIWEIVVPKELVHRLIGPQGKFISFLRRKSGAKIYVTRKPYLRDSQVCHIEAGIICAAPGLDGAWLRAQVISYFAETGEVELRYVDYGGYDKVKVNTLRQIRSDFLSLPFQAAEVLLDNVVPLPDEDRFSPEADAAVGEMTRGAVLVAQVANYDSATGLPLIQLWNLMGDEVVSVNRTLVERGLARWLDY
ncbi:A-kinase anchor protein 1, mitochondrial isoform X1 [Neopsephotus bourkii]|uniref:A-kinase anchor protein 1, mitochondrial isoform X1 n=1 Tax=Neopsephotus bourkii TaxID=309878 RepID=UPI002AA54602|nr:A-kinase anchor protein 1, mitochondrial isoform X1 [Neopsephotus bourkii]